MVRYVVLPDGAERISAYCFYRSPLREIFVPSSVTVIEQKAFALCSLLRNLVLQKDSGLKTIQKEAFA